MNIPHRVEIKKGLFYYIAYVDRFDDKDQLGYCLDKTEKNANRMILIKKDCAANEQYIIFIHELLHAIEFEYKLQIPHKLIYALEGPLAEILTMNPSAFAASLTSVAKKKRPIRKKKRG